MKPTGGEVILHDGDEKLSVFELSHREMRHVRANMQMIFQDPFASLNERMTVLENVIEPLVCNGIGTSQEREAKAEHLLMQVGLQKNTCVVIRTALAGGSGNGSALLGRYPLSRNLLSRMNPFFLRSMCRCRRKS